MKDQTGLYYYPSMQTQDVRMYVRENGGSVEFRMWHKDNPEVWERHQWLPIEVVEHAAAQYRERGTDRNPMALYDLAVARRLIKDGK